MESARKRFYLTGQSTFHNRGCEAIVRSTVGLLRRQFPEAEILVPSSDASRDSAHWPDAAASGVRFVPAVSPWYTRYWVHAQRLPIPALKRAGWPLPLPGDYLKTLAGVDAALSVGGDTYSLDYNLPSLFMGLDSAAMNAGKPAVLWGASVGPFEKEPAFVPTIRKHLARMELITARESVTAGYLRGMGLTNVVDVTDPAFTLMPEEIDLAGFWPDEAEAGLLGLNLSPFIDRHGESLVDEIAEFVRSAVSDSKMSVLLVPHVIPTSDTAKDNDAYYLDQVAARVRDLGGRVRMMARDLNAAQTKFAISKCRFFIGARTHATIAALSSCVPTISIAYSVKAKGINQDLFGRLDYVLETSKVSRGSLGQSLMRLIADEDAVKGYLRERIPVWQARAGDGLSHLARVLEA